MRLFYYWILISSFKYKNLLKYNLFLCKLQTLQVLDILNFIILVLHKYYKWIWKEKITLCFNIYIFSNSWSKTEILWHNFAEKTIASTIVYYNHFQITIYGKMFENFYDCGHVFFQTKFCLGSKNISWITGMSNYYCFDDKIKEILH